MMFRNRFALPLAPLTVFSFSLAFSLAFALAWPSRAEAEPRRFALLVGESTGLAGDEPLRFAEADAQRVAAVLRDLGGFAAEDIVTMTDTSAAAVRRALIAVNARVRDVPGETLLFVFYSGHADASALHLAGTLLSAGELRDLVAGSPATARVLVIDACRSGGATRKKGGRRAPAFAIDVQERLQSHGVAILHSSAEGEDSQESDQLSASFFTHYLVSALRGAADADADGRVTLVEAFTFASERTLTATARTIAGPQHPTYRFDLAGREDLVLTYPAVSGEHGGALRFTEPGSYLVQGKDTSGPLVAEIEVAGGARTLALPGGEYLVTRRAPDHLLQGRFTVAAAQATPVAAAAMERIAYARVVRKGGTPLHRSVSALVAAGGRGGYGPLRAGPRLAAGLRLDWPALSLEARLHAAWSEGTESAARSPEKGVQRGRELGVTLLGLRVLDLGRTQLAAGLALGAMSLTQELGTDPSLGVPHRRAAIVGAVGQLQRGLAGPAYARAELSGLAYVFSPATEDSDADTRWLWQADLALGVYF